jgi:hypothetical protein
MSLTQPGPVFNGVKISPYNTPHYYNSSSTAGQFRMLEEELKYYHKAIQDLDAAKNQVLVCQEYAEQQMIPIKAKLAEEQEAQKKLDEKEAAKRQARCDDAFKEFDDADTSSKKRADLVQEQATLLARGISRVSIGRKWITIKVNGREWRVDPKSGDVFAKSGKKASFHVFDYVRRVGDEYVRVRGDLSKDPVNQ